jgi:histidine triad (HIT) family protein
MTTIFGKIIQGKLPCKKVFENERILVIEDISPLAPVHLLVLPKKEILNLQAVQPEDWPLIAEMMQVIQQLAVELGIEEGYRVVTNNGSEGGQGVMHLHFHVLGGRQLHHNLG